MESNEAINTEKSEVEYEGDSSSPMKLTNVPVVYKLVRIKVDGTLVPATDEDVIEAGLMLQEDNEENTGDFVSDLVNPTPERSDINSVQGSSLSEKSVGCSRKLTDRFERVEAMLRNGNEDEKLGTHRSGEVVTHCAKESRCLDKLTIPELQEVFMATYGRSTLVEDKYWLKQRLLESDIFASKHLPRKRMSSSGYDLPQDTKRARKPTKRYIEECSSSGSLEDEFRNDGTDEGEGRKGEEIKRKKRHRVWSQWEVIRLVEGVSKYGVGRWSEIKRLVFTSQCHRTSADLKDKWRNLLRASLNELPSEKKNATKQNNIAPSIPSWILERVRELAEISNPP